MKTLLAVAIVGLAIGFSMPAHAQNKDTVDPKIAQQRNLLGDPNALGEFGALGIKVDEAFKNNDAGAVAALFTEEGVLVASDGMFFGRQAIEKRYADTFQRWPITTFSGQRSCLNAIDNAAGPKFERGYWSAIYVREGDTWKIRLLTISDAPQFIGYSP
jgi:hypothetical protein